MDKKIGMTIVVMFLLMIITMTIRSQVSSIETSAEFSKDTVSHTARSAGTVLHVMDSSEEHEFGKLERDEFNDLNFGCGRYSGWEAFEGDIRVVEEDTLDVCGPSTNPYSYWSDNGILTGIVIEEDEDTMVTVEEENGQTRIQQGGEVPEWMVIG